MVIITLKGGLGNQMFQYAAGRGMCNKERLLYDLSFLNNNSQSSESFTARNFELAIFKNLKAKQLSKLQYKIFLGKRLRKMRNFFFPNFYCVQQTDSDFHFNDIGSSRPLLLDGYFQSEKHFSHIRKDLLKEFTFPNVIFNGYTDFGKKISGSENAVSIHIRRGDYLKPLVAEYHGVLQKSYYEQSIKFVESEISNPEYFIFSDDQNWCVENLQSISNRVTFVNTPSPSKAWIDMYLMTKCKHHIIANSSFSWWGAWLSSGNGITVAPSKWFNSNAVQYDINDIVPKSWYII